MWDKNAELVTSTHETINTTEAVVNIDIRDSVSLVYELDDVRVTCVKSHSQLRNNQGDTIKIEFPHFPINRK